MAGLPRLIRHFKMCLKCNFIYKDIDKIMTIGHYNHIMRELERLKSYDYKLDKSLLKPYLLPVLIEIIENYCNVYEMIEIITIENKIKEMKYYKYYQFINYFFNKINNVVILDITNKDIDIYVDMFEKMINAFHRCIPGHMFLPYSFIITKFSELLGKDVSLYHKNYKIYEKDKFQKYWKIICDDLNWKCN